MSFGRFKIFTDYREVTDDNIERVLLEAYPLFTYNVNDIDRLYNYYLGVQPILFREKKIRPEINNKIVENHAFNIAQFRSGYLLEKPIEYVANKDAVDNRSLIFLNSCMEMEGKDSEDNDIAVDRAVCGTAYRLCLPNKNYIDDGDESPFGVDRIDPRQGFVIYSSDIGNEALVGAIVLIEKIDNEVQIKIQAYTKDKFYVYNYSKARLEVIKPHVYGGIPLIEYPLNKERLSAFEPVIGILDAVNTISSNRVDGVEQFIQAILVFKNIEVTKEMLEKLQQLGAINITDTGEIKASVDFLQQELNQEQVQKLVDYMIQTAYRICGVPYSRGSASDSGQSTILHDGWSEIEAKVKNDELTFKKSEREFLKLALRYCRILTKGTINVKLMDIQIKFTRRIYENTYQKAQTLDLLLRNEKVAPRLAFSVCGLFTDPEESWAESEKWGREHGAFKTTEELNNELLPKN